MHSGPENLKKSRQKNSWNQINQRFFSWTCIFGSFPSSKIVFCPFLKLQKMEFDQKIFREIDLFDFTSFLAWTFLNFLAHCVGRSSSSSSVRTGSSPRPPCHASALWFIMLKPSFLNTKVPTFFDMGKNSHYLSKTKEAFHVE